MRERRVSVMISILAVFLFTVSIVRPSLAHEPITDTESVQQSNRGPFSLVDHEGRHVTNETYIGKYLLVYFGYTNCPDVCPIDLQTISIALDILGSHGESVQPIFVTADPKRDTVEVMADYVRNFHPRLVGLTGNKEQVDAAARMYGVRSQKLYPFVFGSDDANENDGNSSYLLRHTASIFLIGPHGDGLIRYSGGVAAEEIAEDIRDFLSRESELTKPHR